MNRRSTMRVRLRLPGWLRSCFSPCSLSPDDKGSPATRGEPQTVVALQHQCPHLRQIQLAQRTPTLLAGDRLGPSRCYTGAMGRELRTCAVAALAYLAPAG